MSKILVGVDLSTESERAVAHAVALGRHSGAEVVIVLVDAVPDLADQPPESMRGIAERYTETLTARLDVHRRELAAMRERWTGHGVELSQLLVDGYPDERLPAVAAEVGAELVVVGSHGRTGWKRALIGSVAERVVRRADCSVLVARGDAPDGGYRHAVIGTDFSAQAERAFTRALPLIARGGRVELVHCWQMPWSATFGEPAIGVPYEDLHGGLERALRDAGDRLRGHLLDRTDVELSYDLLPAPPAHGLADLAAERQSDLVVVGSHGRRGARRLILGSVAEVAVRHSPCSVLVVH